MATFADPPSKLTTLVELPPEVLVKIIKLLPLAFIHYEIPLVCKQFRNLVRSNFDTIKYLSLIAGHYNPNVDKIRDKRYDGHGDQALMKLIPYIQSHRPNILTMSMTLTFKYMFYTKPEPRDLFLVLPLLTTVVALELNGTMPEDCEDIIQDWKQVLGNLDRLKHLSVEEMKLDLWLSLYHIKNLKTLKVGRFESSRYEDDEMDKRVSSIHNPKPLDNVMDLKVDAYTRYNDSDEIFCGYNWFSKPFANVKRIEIRYLDSVNCRESIDMLDGLARNCPKLTTLHLTMHAEHQSWLRNDPTKQKMTPRPDHEFSNLKQFWIAMISHEKVAHTDFLHLMQQWPRFHECFRGFSKLTTPWSQGVEIDATIYATDEEPKNIKEVFTDKLKSNKVILDKILGPGRKVFEDKEFDSNLLELEHQFSGIKIE